MDWLHNNTEGSDLTFVLFPFPVKGQGPTEGPWILSRTVNLPKQIQIIWDLHRDSLRELKFRSSY